LIEPGSTDFWMPLFATMISHSFFFLFSAYRKDNGVIDIAWGLSFIIGNLTIIGIRVNTGGSELNVDTRTILVNVLVGVWGLRMAAHIAGRTEMGSEDRRFAQIREMLMRNGGAVLFYSVSYFGVFLCSTFWIALINSPALYVSMRS
jgi:steroid 5-alpha reductase family enzyme